MPAFPSAGPRAARLKRWADLALDRCFPGACLLCDAPGSVLCAACRAEAVRPLAFACPRCAAPLPAASGRRSCGRCLRHPPGFDATIAAVAYTAPIDQLLRGLKYGARLAYAPMLADLLHGRVAEESPALAVDHLIPIPLSRERMTERGFNQSIEIGRRLAGRLRTSLMTDAVLRIVDTEAQAALPFDERRKNIRGAFAVVEGRRDRLVGSTVGVVDDVMTTGSTLDEFAAVLKRAGVARVVNLVVARTP